MTGVALLVVASLAGPSKAADAPKTRIYIANDDHTDYMWTADAATYDQVFAEMLDFHLRLIDETAGNPSPFQSRFNADGTFWLWNYERRRTPAEFERLIARIRSGHVSVPLNALVSCYGGQPAEAVLRGMYYAGQLERRHGLRFSQAAPWRTRRCPSGSPRSGRARGRSSAGAECAPVRAGFRPRRSRPATTRSTGRPGSTASGC